MQTSCPHIISGNFTSHRKFLDDVAYGEALDSIVKGCSDLLVVSADGKSVLLGKRLVHPQPDWWFIGGRMMPGDTPGSSCTRIVRRELGLELDPTRFTYVCSASLAWDMREQAPRTNGTTDVQIVLSLRLTADEAGRIKLDAKEYADSKWMEPQAVLAGDFHPALKHACANLLKRDAYTRLAALAAEPVSSDSDAKVAAAAREMLAIDVPISSGTSSYVIKFGDYQGAVNVVL
mmetsp:Transcript_7859/g.21426  ORF Transcript_7859/g.21426 Transcript_7859/m.21426 type:complete len:233 (+) Transcript_7859:53-751(+)|eukprot:CAMPEP_0185184512 /NCGR_PEP_ID=MMETSP1140-20130426/2628_1 /TAXON_ID=298111 /ORGANISM="Pavlova sp., Strain CCMP459" /LENGTH=232 /DNA_ID=CAMNT_0027750591 /DNA_START=50 /DNA_END=748 /DNA_ORIENTATION=+